MQYARLGLSEYPNVISGGGMQRDWPGLGLLTIEAIQRRDYPLVQGCVLIIASFYVVANLLADLLGLWLDPRQRH